MELKKPAAAPAQPKSVNDVTAPPVAQDATAPVAPPAPKLADDSPDAIMVHEQSNEGRLAAPLNESALPTDAPAPEDKKHKKKDKGEKVTANVPKKQRTGIGGVIFAAVVIILGLGAMFTYAYLRSQNIALF